MMILPNQQQMSSTPSTPAPMATAIQPGIIYQQQPQSNFIQGAAYQMQQPQQLQQPDLQQSIYAQPLAGTIYTSAPSSADGSVFVGNQGTYSSLTPPSSSATSLQLSSQQNSDAKNIRKPSNIARGGEGPPGANIFVYNIPNSYADADLDTLFSQFGDVLSTKVFIDRATKESKNFGLFELYHFASDPKDSLHYVV